MTPVSFGREASTCFPPARSGLEERSDLVGEEDRDPALLPRGAYDARRGDHLEVADDTRGTTDLHGDVLVDRQAGAVDVPVMAVLGQDTSSGTATPVLTVAAAERTPSR